ncbi:hypothetical protein Cs7R123_00040 [Catellatospora sp. TT07R-123]|uniref:AAA family ATPase n=1 Tax=Catellatospora sp. TT07R-123 TaxID=2733863 RepID=UPI001B1E040E|nr:AAA family ATPase [Catellatospora sp. TT07R-123]GHJ42662.1 hypothetical protein Cs7R123_00040 [Catellatospora sp. TT07R-123]
MQAFDGLCPPGPGGQADSGAVADLLARLRTAAGLGPGAGDAVRARAAVQALTGSPRWWELPRLRQVPLLAAVLLLEVAAADRAEDGHGRRADLVARRTLWELGAAPAWREHVAALVRHHEVPLRAMHDPDLERTVLRVSLLASNADLALLARARGAGDEQVALFEEYCAELGVLDAAWPFASDHARFQYFRTPGRDPRYAAHDDTGAVVTVLSGLPGVGKDFWTARNRPGQPVVSLDELRLRLGVAPTGDQGTVVAAAYEQARRLLRAGQPFVWNATNVTRRQRDGCIGLAAAYRARVEVVALEAPPQVVRVRNSGRAAVVPQAAWDRMAARWQAPDITEAHAVHRIDTGMMDHFT